VFLAAAYAAAEREFTTRLKAHLQARGVTVLSSRTLRRQGVENQRKALQEAIRTAKAILLIASPETRSSRHVQKALQMAGIYRSPICAVWIDGESWQECVPLEHGEIFATIDVRKLNGQHVFEDIVATLEESWLASNEMAVSVATTNGSLKTPLEPRNPYKGLKAFRSQDRHDFFGRDLLIGELVEKVKGMLAAQQPDKSSVVMAGLLPRMLRGALHGSERWLYLEPMVPGARPVEALALTFAPCLSDRSVKSIREDLEDESARGLHLLVKQIMKMLGQQVVLVVDQFEELFTQTSSEEDRQHFIDLLVTAAKERQGSILLILTLRADFSDRPLAYPELSRLIMDHQVVALPMEVQELREVIEGPAALPDVQLSFEGNLVGDLLFEVQGQVGALPLLQFTLEQLFERRSDHRLTLTAYRELGGVKGAISQHAERTYAALPSEDHRKLAHALFARLIDPGASEQETTRRRAAPSELVLADASATRLVRETADAFIAARLLMTNEVAGTTTLEVSHEAVIREWRRLAEWIREAREDLHLLQVIRDDTAEWQRHERSPDRLYRGTQLTEALAWRERSLPSLDEDAFLQASVAEQERQEGLEAEQKQQERRYKRRTVLVGLGVGLAGLGIAGTGIALNTVLRPKAVLPPLPLPYSYRRHTDQVESELPRQAKIQRCVFGCGYKTEIANQEKNTGEASEKPLSMY
jgi:hypothetical protein